MGSPRVGSNPAVVVVVHLWPSGLRRYVQVVVIIRWRRFESCRVHINVLPLGPVGGSRALRPQAAGSIPVKYSISDGGLAQSVECVVSNDEARGSKPRFSISAFVAQLVRALA